MSILHDLRERAPIALAATSGCIFPGAVGAWWMSNDYAPALTQAVCAAAPFLALMGYGISSAALDMIKDAPSLQREDAWRHNVLPLFAAWLLSVSAAPAGALALAFPALGSLAAARLWRSSARG